MEEERGERKKKGEVGEREGGGERWEGSYIYQL